MNKSQDKLPLIAQVKEGNVIAFNQLFDIYAVKLLNFSLRFTLDSDQAEEVLQETFIKIWEKKEQINLELSFEAYLIKIARNIIYNKLRRKVTDHAFKNYYQYIQPVIDNSLESKIIAEDLEKYETTIIDKLPTRRKEIILLKKNGYSNAEIAQKLNLSKSTVENHINLALKNLSRYFHLI